MRLYFEVRNQGALGLFAWVGPWPMPGVVQEHEAFIGAKGEDLRARGFETRGHRVCKEGEPPPVEELGTKFEGRA